MWKNEVMAPPATVSERLLEHPLYHEAYSHLKRAEWEEALRCLHELQREFPGSPVLEALEQDTRFKTYLAHPLYGQVQAHLQRAEWQEALRYLHQLQRDFPGSPLLEALEQETRLKAHYDRQGPQFHRGSGLPWRKLVFQFLLVMTVIVACGIGYLVFNLELQPRLEQNRRIAQIESSIREGQLALGRGDYDAAARQFEAALVLAPDDLRAQDGLRQAERGKELRNRYQRAVDLVKAERWSEARTALLAVAEVQPGYLDVDRLMEQVTRQLDAAGVFLAGEEAFQAGAWRDAMAHLETLRSLDSTYERDTVIAHLSHSYLELARELAAQIGSNDEAASEALGYFNKVLTLQPRDPEALAGRQEMQEYLEAVRLVNEQDWEKAIPRLGALRAIRPDYADGKVAGWLLIGYRVTGDQAAQAGNFALAEERYGLLLKLTQETNPAGLPQLYDVHLSAAGAAVQSKDYSLALLHYQEALMVTQALRPDAYPGDVVNVYVEQAEEAVRQRDYAAAVEQYRLALQAAWGEGPSGATVVKDQRASLTV